MPETDIAGAIATDLTNTVTEYDVASETTDGPTGQKEFRFQMEDWEENLGFYKRIPELQSAIDAKALWVIGAGFTSDPITELLLLGISGNGKDTFNTILENCIRTYTIAGDSFCEIIRDENELLINLKPLDPSSMVIVSNAQGRIIKYEQVTKAKKVTNTFEAEDIFHLSRKRLADEIHGISVIPAVKEIIKIRNEAMTDYRRVLHRNIDPLWVFHLDTDDTSKIAEFKTKMDTARGKGESMYVPKGAVVPELISTSMNASLNPVAWIAQNNDSFFQAVNVPQIIVGQGKEFTDSSAKITYLAYEQSVKGDQLYVEGQVLGQLNIEIQLTFPASLQNELISDTSKQSELAASEPNDTTTEIEGKT